MSSFPYKCINYGNLNKSFKPSTELETFCNMLGMRLVFPYAFLNVKQ